MMSDINNPLLPPNYPDTRRVSGPQRNISSEQSKWVEKRHLGQGTFGRVSLWVKTDDETQEMAIKFYDRNADHTVLVRNLKEEQLLQQTKHPNIVCYLKPPVDFINPQAYMGCGVICMEYCNRGDLRKMIKQSENVFGISQNLVLLFLGDISSALHYLHNQNIIHRDIKPENILIKSESPNSVAFKLVDLGFATQFTVKSNFNTFVGTMQYFPPEMLEVGLRMGGTVMDDDACPNSSVDVWAFGIVVFELICGTRPFVPTLPGMEWLKFVKNKEKQHICIYKDSEGQECYSTEFLKPNQLDEPFAKAIANWLIIMLDKDPMTRGGRDKARNINESEWPNRLEQILTTCYIKVAVIHELRIKFYEYFPGLNINTFIQRVIGELGYQDMPIILCSDGRIFDPESTIDQCLTNKHSGEIYVLPRTRPLRPPPIELDVPLSVLTALDHSFSAIDSTRFNFVVNPVFEYAYKRYHEVMVFLRAGVSLQCYMEEHLKEVGDLEHKLRINSETIYSRCSFIKENVLDYILRELESFLARADSPEQATNIRTSIDQFCELRDIINSNIAEVHAIDTDHCESAAEMISQAKGLFTRHPCQAYIKELQMRLLHLQSVVRLLIDMSDQSYYANGTRLASDITEFIEFINNRFMEMQSYFLECISVYKSISEHRSDFHRTITLLDQEFLTNLNIKFVSSFRLAFQSAHNSGPQSDSMEAIRTVTPEKYEVSSPGELNSLDDLCNQMQNICEEIHSLRDEYCPTKIQKDTA